MNDEVSKQLGAIAKAAKDAGDDRLAKWIAYFYLIEVYPESVRDELLAGVDAALQHLAKLSRDAVDRQDEREARDWFRDFEWPDELL